MSMIQYIKRILGIKNVQANQEPSPFTKVRELTGIDITEYGPREVAEITGCYGEVLTSGIEPYAHRGYPESLLPHERAVIKATLMLRVLYCPEDIDICRHGYTELAYFIPDDEVSLAQLFMEFPKVTEGAPPEDRVRLNELFTQASAIDDRMMMAEIELQSEWSNFTSTL
jgi:hypothetical protein